MQWLRWVRKALRVQREFRLASQTSPPPAAPPFESARRWWVNSGCDALVVMVESTKVANLYDTTATLGMHLPLLGAVHREGLMNPVTMDDMSL